MFDKGPVAVLALGKALLRCRALGDLLLQALLDPHQLDQGGDLGPEDGRLEGLVHVVDRPARVPLEMVLLGSADRGEKDDRDVPGLLTKLDQTGGPEPIQAGHLHVQHDEGELLAQEPPEGLLAGGDGGHVQSQRLEHRLEGQQVVRAIVHKQEPGATLRGRAVRRGLVGHHRYNHTRIRLRSLSRSTGLVM